MIEHYSKTSLSDPVPSRLYSTIQWLTAFTSLSLAFGPCCTPSVVSTVCSPNSTLSRPSLPPLPIPTLRVNLSIDWGSLNSKSTIQSVYCASPWRKNTFTALYGKDEKKFVYEPTMHTLRSKIMFLQGMYCVESHRCDVHTTSTETTLKPKDHSFCLERHLGRRGTSTPFC